VAKMTIGVALGRRKAQLAVVGGDSCARTLLVERELTRPPDASPSRTLKDLLAELPERFRNQTLALALSSGDLACDDLWEAPEGLRARDVAAVAPVLLEARSTGETLEQLAVDVRLAGGTLAAVALGTQELQDLLRESKARGVRLRLVTSIPAALADVFGRKENVAISWAGQRVDVERRDGKILWRSVPQDGTEEPPATPLALGGLTLTPGQAAAVAVALADSEVLPDALRGAPGAPRSFGTRFRGPLRALAVAAALFLAALGLSFRAQERRFQAELAAGEQEERSLWKRHFSDRTPVRGDLLRAAKDRLRDSGQAGGDATVPSAFLFFMDLGRHLPDADALWLTLDTLDVSPEGGRMSASVSSVPGDVLRNAALLEAKVNESSRMTARGDFEARERDVQVRLKMDYRSR